MRALALITLSLVLAACAGPVLEPVAPPQEIKPFEARLEVRQVWEQELGEGVRFLYISLPPLTDGERVYAANKEGLVSAFAAEDGKRLWRVKLEGSISGGPGDGGNLLLLGGDAEVLALDKRDGSLAWRAEVSSEVLSAPVRSGDTVVVRCVDGSVTALDAASGKLRWRELNRVPQLTLRGESAPLLAHGGVFLGLYQGKVRVLALDDGRELWNNQLVEVKHRNEVEAIADVDADLLLDGPVLYTAAYQGRIAALVASTGRMIWSRSISSYTGMTSSGDNVYITDQAGALWALNNRGGSSLWKSEELSGRQLTAPVRQGGYLVVGDYQGYLHWFDAESGMIVGRSRVEEPRVRYSNLMDEYSHTYPESRRLLAAPVVDGKRVYAMDMRGVLAAFEVSLIEEAE